MLINVDLPTFVVVTKGEKDLGDLECPDEKLVPLTIELARIAPICH